MKANFTEHFLPWNEISPPELKQVIFTSKGFLRKRLFIFSYYRVRGTPSGGQPLITIKSAFSCFLLEGFVPLGGFLADQKAAKFCPSIRGRARGDTEIFMPDWSQTNSNFCQTTGGLKIWQCIFKYCKSGGLLRPTHWFSRDLPSLDDLGSNNRWSKRPFFQNIARIAKLPYLKSEL